MKKYFLVLLLPLLTSCIYQPYPQEVENLDPGPSLTYNAKVVIVSGFYKGYIGHLVDMNEYNGMCYVDDLKAQLGERSFVVFAEWVPCSILHRVEYGRKIRDLNIDDLQPNLNKN